LPCWLTWTAAVGTTIDGSSRSVMRVVTSSGPGGILTRTMLPAVILVPPLLGWFRLLGQRSGWYGTEFLCLKGHGLLHVPEIPTTYNTQRWMDLDASWGSLFS